TPLKITAVSLLVNIVFNLILMYPLKLKGLALATSLSGGINF
ncbi:MAG TPA: virulence factor MviN, partial [Candidatus Omnitrophica bacterium]|nr:virulence factor MviN [Candidatus Omnitrophota bacterium]